MNNIILNNTDIYILNQAKEKAKLLDPNILFMQYYEINTINVERNKVHVIIYKNYINIVYLSCVIKYNDYALKRIKKLTNDETLLENYRYNMVISYGIKENKILYTGPLLLPVSHYNNELVVKSYTLFGYYNFHFGNEILYKTLPIIFTSPYEEKYNNIMIKKYAKYHDNIYLYMKDKTYEAILINKNYNEYISDDYNRDFLNSISDTKEPIVPYFLDNINIIVLNSSKLDNSLYISRHLYNYYDEVKYYTHYIHTEFDKDIIFSHVYTYVPRNRTICNIIKFRYYNTIEKKYEYIEIENISNEKLDNMYTKIQTEIDKSKKIIDILDIIRSN